METNRAAWPELPYAEWRDTFDAAAETGRWDRRALECPAGTPGEPRKITS